MMQRQAAADDDDAGMVMTVCRLPRLSPASATLHQRAAAANIYVQTHP